MQNQVPKAVTKMIEDVCEDCLQKRHAFYEKSTSENQNHFI